MSIHASMTLGHLISAQRLKLRTNGLQTFDVWVSASYSWRFLVINLLVKMYEHIYRKKMLVYVVWFIVYNVWFIVYSLLFTIYDLQSTVYSLQYTFYSILLLKLSFEKENIWNYWNRLLIFNSIICDYVSWGCQGISKTPETQESPEKLGACRKSLLQEVSQEQAGSALVAPGGLFRVCSMLVVMKFSTLRKS